MITLEDLNASTNCSIQSRDGNAYVCYLLYKHKTVNFLYYCIYKAIERHPHLGSARVLSMLVLSICIYAFLYLFGYTAFIVYGIKLDVSLSQGQMGLLAVLGGVALFWLYYETLGGRGRALSRYGRFQNSNVIVAIGYLVCLLPVISPLLYAALMVIIHGRGEP